MKVSVTNQEYIQYSIESTYNTTILLDEIGPTLQSASKPFK